VAKGKKGMEFDGFWNVAGLKNKDREFWKGLGDEI